MFAPSTGQLIAERIKYKVKELNIVVNDTDGAAISALHKEMELKKLIQKMTCAKPEERLPATEVLHIIETICSSLIKAPQIATVSSQKDELKSSESLAVETFKKLFYQIFIVLW